MTSFHGVRSRADAGCRSPVLEVICIKLSPAMEDGEILIPLDINVYVLRRAIANRG